MAKTRKMLTADIRLSVLQRDNFACRYCGTFGTADTLVIDHVIPLSHGGTNDIDNLAAACHRCNMTKAARELSEYLVDAVSTNTEYYQHFLESLKNTNKLAQINSRDEKSQTVFYRLLFANTITAMETYLSDAFIHTVVNDWGNLQTFLETTPAFSERKYKLSEIISWTEDIKKAATEYLLEIIYHNVFKVKNMYKDTLGIDFPDDMEPIQTAVMMRHDIVHRNGKDKGGNALSITQKDVVNNINLIRGFIKYIDEQLNEGRGSDLPQ